MAFMKAVRTLGRAARRPLLTGPALTGVIISTRYASRSAATAAAEPALASAATGAQSPTADEVGIRSVVLYVYASCPFCNKVLQYWCVIARPASAILSNMRMPRTASANCYKLISLACLVNQSASFGKRLHPWLAATLRVSHTRSWRLTRFSSGKLAGRQIGARCVVWYRY